MDAKVKISELPSWTPLDTDIIPYVDLTTWTTKKALKSELKWGTWDNATVTAWTTTTWNPWTNASVTNVGTTSDAIFNFVIPRWDVWATWSQWPTWSWDVNWPVSATDNAIVRFDTTTGKLIQNSLATISDIGVITAPEYSVDWILLWNNLENVLSTSKITENTLTINTDTSKFNIWPFIARFVNNYTDTTNPTISVLSYAWSTANTVTNLATSDVTFISWNWTSIVQRTVQPTTTQLRDEVLLWSLTHTNHTSISSAIAVWGTNWYDIALGLNDLSLSIWPINRFWNVYSWNATSWLKVDKSAGETWQVWLNSTDKKNPNIVTNSSNTATTFLYIWRNWSGWFNNVLTDTVVPWKYDDWTWWASTPNWTINVNKWQSIRLYKTIISNLTILEYWQIEYNSLELAIANKSINTITSPVLEVTQFRGWLFVRGWATDLKLSSDAFFQDAWKLSSTQTSWSVWSSITTIQGSYNNSTQPQIVTDSTKWALQIKRWSWADTDKILQGLNWAWTETFWVTWEWKVVAGTYNSNTISSWTTSWTNTWDQTSVTWNAWTVTTINGKISAWTNVTTTWTWTNADPYIINSTSGGTWHTIQDEWTPLTTRTNLNFVWTWVTVTDWWAWPNSTIVTITSWGWSGDVVWPASAVNNNFVSFDTTTWKLIKDSWSKASDFQTALWYTAENVVNKDATWWYAWLTLFKINFKNALNTITSFFTNANTVARTYTFPNKDITVAGLVDITWTNSWTNTWDQTSIVWITWTKTQFNTSVSDWDIIYIWDTVTWLIQNTNKLLWRNTAWSWAVEEITLWTWLSFTWTTLNSTGITTADAYIANRIFL